jgi:endonuclease YncB( thermonuclease family)
MTTKQILNSHDLYKKTLLSKTKKNTPYFCDIKGNFVGKCVSVYDGDTINIVFNPFSIKTDHIYRFRTRLLGIDTPEIKTKNLKEKEKALLVRQYLRDLILDKIIFIKCEGFDKYGRLLAYIYTESYSHCDIVNNDNNLKMGGMLNSVNQMLINKDYAYLYDGGTKKNIIY